MLQTLLYKGDIIGKKPLSHMECAAKGILTCIAPGPTPIDKQILNCGEEEEYSNSLTQFWKRVLGGILVG